LFYFDRICKIIIVGNQEITIENSRIQFEITKSRVAKENTAKIDIYNLSHRTRKSISDDEFFVRIFAGYVRDKGLIEIGQGDVSKVKHNRDKTEVVTEIYLAEGLKTIRDNPISISFSSKSKLKLSSIIDNLKTKGSFIFKIIDFDDSKMIENGYSDIGSIDRILDNLSEHFDFTWSMQNGVIIIKGNKISTLKEVMLLTPESGLILHPETVKKVSRRLNKSTIVQEDKKTSSIQSLLMPFLQINDIIEVRSQDYQGFYEIQKITHRGDTRGNDWYSDLEIMAK